MVKHERHVEVCSRLLRTGAASAASEVGARRHNENDVTMTIADLCRYGAIGDMWPRVAPL